MGMASVAFSLSISFFPIAVSVRKKRWRTKESKNGKEEWNKKLTLNNAACKLRN